MKYDIKAKAGLTDLERQELEDLSHAVYPPDMPPNGAEKIEWASSEWGVFIRDDDGQLVSFIGLITRDVKCDDQDIFMGGIGGVKTHPDARGQGYAGFGLQWAAEYLRDELKVDVSLLVCRDHLISYYGKFGWQLFEGDTLVEQSTGKDKFTFDNVLLLPANKPIPQCDVIDLCGKPW